MEPFAHLGSVLMKILAQKIPFKMTVYSPGQRICSFYMSCALIQENRHQNTFKCSYTALWWADLANSDYDLFNHVEI